MDTKCILDFLMNEIGESQAVAERQLKELNRHPDIESELMSWIKDRKFPENPVSVQGYTAEKICSMSDLLPIGAYNFLIFLREEPEVALKDLKAGFPRK